MAIDTAYVGRSFPYPQPYVVGVEKIREFAAAIGETAAVCTDRAAARAAGYADLVAPPTFAIVVAAGAQDAILFGTDLGVDFSRVVHGDQRFEHHRPIVAGDELTCEVHVDAVRVLAGNEVITLRTEITDPSSAPVCTCHVTLVVRGGAE